MKTTLRDGMPPAYNPKLASIIMLVFGAIFVLIWFPLSLMAGLLSDAGLNAPLLIGIDTLIFGPVVLYVVFLFLVIRAMKRTRRSWPYALVALLSAPIMIGIGIVLVTIGSTMPKG